MASSDSESERCDNNYHQRSRDDEIKLRSLELSHVMIQIHLCWTKDAGRRILEFHSSWKVVCYK